MASGFGKLKPKTRGRDSLRLDELVEVLKYPDKQWVRLRFIEGNILPVATHWIKILTPKQKKEISISKLCIAFDPNNEDTPKKGVKCPYCELDDQAGGRTSRHYLANAIIRDEQDDEPVRKASPTTEEKRTGIKDISSKSWTPIKVVRMPTTLVTRLMEISELNVRKNTKTGKKEQRDIMDPKFGCDVMVKYKKDAKGTDMYSADRDTESRYTPITRDESKYLKWDISEKLLDVMGIQTQEEAIKDLKSMHILGGENIEDDEDDEDDDEYSSNSGLELGEDSSESRRRSSRSGRSKKSRSSSRSSRRGSSRKKSGDGDGDEGSSRRKSSSSESKDEVSRGSSSSKRRGSSSRRSKSSSTSRSRKPKEDVDYSDDDIPF